MLEQKKNAAIGMMLGASARWRDGRSGVAQATQDTSKATNAGHVRLFRPGALRHQRTRRRDRYVRREGRHGQHRHVEDGQ